MTFLSRSERDLRDERLRAAVRNATGLMAGSRVEALDTLEDPGGLRDAARTLRAGVMAELPELLDAWSSRLEALGGHVHWARDGAEAVVIIRDLVRRHDPRVVAKGKSMASEEIHLNEALEAAGREVVETDLGEFIIQLAGETPSHIIAPAIHHDRYDVADLFADRRGPPGRGRHHRGGRLRRGCGCARASSAPTSACPGVNFAVAETGSICLVENEGNGRMCTSVPQVHIAVMGMERIVRDWAELDLMLGLLARSATGQALSVYTNIITGPRRADGRRRPRRAPRGGPRQRALRDPRHRVPRDAPLHPLRRLPERLPGLPPGRRPRLRLGVLRAHRRGAHAAARTARILAPRSWPTPRRCAARAGTPARCASPCTTCSYSSAGAMSEGTQAGSGGPGSVHGRGCGARVRGSGPVPWSVVWAGGSSEDGGASRVGLVPGPRDGTCHDWSGARAWGDHEGRVPQPSPAPPSPPAHRLPIARSPPSIAHRRSHRSGPTRQRPSSSDG